MAVLLKLGTPMSRLKMTEMSAVVIYLAIDIGRVDWGCFGDDD